MDVKAALGAKNSDAIEPCCSPISSGLLQSLAPEGSSVSTEISRRLQPNSLPTVSTGSKAERRTQWWRRVCAQNIWSE